ncbi:uncharacterized protein LOC106162963 [Lingula anatina]|uniref:Uncharacterized protein LOC106162963 n=1 Tax=Lingula anatina TaxID=7574 RepID=A0A1S3IDE0_LINAN|nr:uncharacterized protein LOC106162963 [Lingula anatina]|eukprot:XP_013395876.1 uncharacterized protein LOC106162963 [Lingula anatina]
MDKLWKLAINKNHTELLENLEVLRVIPHLYQNNILDDDDEDDIVSTNGREAKCEVLFGYILRKDPALDPFGHFIRALQCTNQNHLADRLTNSYTWLEQEGYGNMDIPENILNDPCVKKAQESCKPQLGYLKSRHQSSDRQFAVVCGTDMDKLWKLAINKNHTELLENLEVLRVIPHLYQNNILDDDDEDDIVSTNGREAKCEVLFGYILRKDPALDPFGHFIRALQCTNQNHLADRLTNSYTWLEQVKKAQESCKPQLGYLNSRHQSSDRQFAVVCENDMELLRRQAIKKNYKLLLRDMNANELLSDLYRNNVINHNQMVIIKAKHSRPDQCECLIGYILRANPELEPLRHFVSALREIKQDHLANSIESTY